MYPNPNYLGGNLPGQQQGQYGQVPAGQQNQGQQQQQYGLAVPFPGLQQQMPTGMAPMQHMAGQPTGFGGPGQFVPMQPQSTGFPARQMQPQPTGFLTGPMGVQPTGLQPGQLSAQRTGFQAGPVPPQPQLQFQTGALPPPPTNPALTAGPFGQSQPGSLSAQKTGLTSSQMADSFRSTGLPTGPQTPGSAPTGSAIPNIRLSFMTAQDQGKFEQLFRSAVGDRKAMTGDEAKDLLVRSGLQGDTLAEIWTLADTTKSGQLLFPEFALAMFLCHTKLSGHSLPAVLPEKMRNEVGSMVDIISFGVPDMQSRSVPTIEHPQPVSAVSNTQLLGQLAGQTGLTPQQTGFQQPQPTGFGMSGPAGVHAQPTGMHLQPTSFHPQQTGFGVQTGMTAPLNAQPTGRPGQWGLVNAPAGGLPNIEALRQRLMPQAAGQAVPGSYTTAGLVGNADVPWSVTKEEKKIYDDLYRAWGGFQAGFIDGGRAIDIFSKSGLERPDLERIWTLADQADRGRLNMDEFAVAMHLIYRKLNGLPIPARLPAELVPPSTRNLNESIGSVKSMLARDAEERKTSGAFLQPQKTGVSYRKAHSFASSSVPATRKDGTVFKNNDDEMGYRSQARRRAPERTNQSTRQTRDSEEASESDLSADQLRKLIREKTVLLDALDVEDERDAERESELDRRDRRAIDDLYARIRQIQSDIDNHSNGGANRSSDGGAERRGLGQQLQGLVDKLPRLASDVRRAEQAIAEAHVELFRLRDAREHPGSGVPARGSGPAGAVTEQDRRMAKARAMMRQRTAALLNKPAEADESEDAFEAALRRAEAEATRVDADKERHNRMVADVEDSVGVFSRTIEDELKAAPGLDSSSEHERRRWEDGLGVEDQVRDFIFELQRDSRARSQHRRPARPETAAAAVAAVAAVAPATDTASSGVSSTAAPTASASAGTPGNTFRSFQTGEDRAAYIKAQAEKRMAERLAALGIKPAAKAGNAAETARLKQQQDEEADRRRQEERQRRLEAEKITPPVPTASPAAAATAAKKKPPPPPARKEGKPAPPPPRPVGSKPTPPPMRVEPVSVARQPTVEAVVQAKEPKVEPTRDEFQKERDAEAQRLRDLERRIIEREDGKRKRAEEKRQRAEENARKAEEYSRKVAADQQRQAARQAERDAAQRREEELQARLAALDNSDSDSGSDWTPGSGVVVDSAAALATGDESDETTPRATLAIESTQPTSTGPSYTSSPSPVHVSAPSSPATESPVAVSVPTSSNSLEGSNNPFLRLSAPGVGNAVPVGSTGETSGAIEPTVPAEVSTNPFHRMSLAGPPAPFRPPPMPTTFSPAGTTASPPTMSAPSSDPAAPGGNSEPSKHVGRRSGRMNRDDDDWSIVSSDSDSGSDSDGPRPGNAQQLAAMLFRTMGGPSRTQTPVVGGNGPTGTDGQDETTPPASARPGMAPPVLPGSDLDHFAPTADGLSDVPAAPPVMPMGIPPPPPAMAPPPMAPPPMTAALPPPPPPMSAPPPPSTSAPAGPSGGPAFLSGITSGVMLRKTKTNDRSTASAGRVL